MLLTTGVTISAPLRLQRRYPLPGSAGRTRYVLCNPETMAVLRYRFRGSMIATPWNEIDSTAPGHRRMTFDETETLGRLQESLSVR